MAVTEFLARKGAVKLSLTLFMAWVGTDHTHNAFTADHLTVLAHPSDRASYLHRHSP